MHYNARRRQLTTETGINVQSESLLTMSRMLLGGFLLFHRPFSKPKPPPPTLAAHARFASASARSEVASRAIPIVRQDVAAGRLGTPWLHGPGEKPTVLRRREFHVFVFQFFFRWLKKPGIKNMFSKFRIVFSSISSCSRTRGV